MHSSCFPRLVPFGLYQISSPVAGSGAFRSLEDAADKVPSLARGSHLTERGRKDQRAVPGGRRSHDKYFPPRRKTEREGENDGSSRE